MSPSKHHSHNDQFAEDRECAGEPELSDKMYDFSQSENVRVVVIRDTKTEPDGTVGTDELEDDAEDVEPRRVGGIVELSSLYAVSTRSPVFVTALDAPR
jgi:hypothetical protein